ncbi:MAG: carbamoyl-phosphate synthase large subunit [Nitrospirae bacterium]|nr:MAG: carbamoyl-phosphate synthase large subunit [Nitrospirota bacterium]
MPKRTDIRKILVIGSGPIVIGQGCEFDYSGTQAVRALRQVGYEVVLVNSNPATIMTDPATADVTYLEPLTPELLAQVVERERPDALLPTMGGQVGLNAAMALHAAGVLDRFGVEMIGATAETIDKAEDRDRFRAAMGNIGLAVPRSEIVTDLTGARAAAERLGFPLIIRPSFTLGGTGGSIAYNAEEFDGLVAFALDASPIHQVLLEESVLGWKEYELEVMRDGADNAIVVCTIENLDAMGVHTGDSITVAPAQTLTDREYQILRDAALAILSEIGVETGGSNVQFAVHPETGRMVVVEMNPRVSRSSALASKATGFPIAKIAALVAVGLRLDEIRNDITRETPACFEPTLDYCVVKAPRFDFVKFPGCDDTLATQMKSVGEVMAIGRTFHEALGKALRSMETGLAGLDPPEAPPAEPEELLARLRTPRADRLLVVAEGLRRGLPVEALAEASGFDPWFVDQVGQVVEVEAQAAAAGPALLEDREGLLRAKRMGLSDRRLGRLLGTSEVAVRGARRRHGIHAAFKRVDTCGGEFVAHTPYLYSTYDEQDEARPTERKKIMILGGGPNRIGQGIEFDYCCVHAAYALKEAGYETIMVNCNPETVSTDYDTSDRLYFEPLTFEDVMEIVRVERPDGVLVQYGGQTPLNLAVPLERAGVRIIGTPPDAIDRTEDRGRFAELVAKLGLLQPPNGIATSEEEAVRVAEQVGYPIVVRPSYVLGGRAMEIVFDDAGLRHYMRHAVKASPEHPVLIDHFLQEAIEVDVDCISDGETVVIGGIMEHIEEAGIHSGDSACSLPPYSLPPEVVEEIRRQTVATAREIGVVGLMNVQYAVKDGRVYTLEVNPRASRTVPFVSKATGRPLAKLGALVMVGRKLPELGVTEEVVPDHFAVKEAVFPFLRLPGADTVLGPEMKSTGEVMGLDRDFGCAVAKAQIAAGTALPTSGAVLFTVKDLDKPLTVPVARRLAELGFEILATQGTAEYLRRHGVAAEAVHKVTEGRPHVVDRITNGEVQLVVNTTSDAEDRRQSFSIRASALRLGVPYFTTVAGAREAVKGIAALQRGELTARPLQGYYAAH